MGREIFFETYRFRTKTYLVYGNLNDVYFAADLQERYFENYLLACLKDRGYEHVIFYADSGTKGGFCLDDESAAFFMPQKKENEEKKLSAGKKGLDSLRNRNTRRVRPSVPGSMSREKNIQAEEKTLRQSALDDRTDRLTFQNMEGAEPEPEIMRYAYKGKILSEFVAELSPRMRQKSSNMAVVFCNIFNNSIEDAVLRESILNDWEKYQEEGARNICILLATESVPDPHNVIAILQKVRLDSKFVYSDGNANYLIPTHCFNIGLPGIDEIEYYLKRIYRGGLLSDEHVKPLIRYKDIPEIARTILYASKQYNSGVDGPIEIRQENLRDIIGRLEQYFRNNRGVEKYLTENTIREIWGIGSQASDCLEELKRPGWEGVYELITSFQREVEAYETIHKEQEPIRDMVVSRFETTERHRETIRMQIPNFILLGNPGTGKTTIARLLGNILHEWHYLEVGHIVEVTKKDLTSSYVAGIPHATMSCVNRAEEGVLFIDEAHLIAHRDGGVNNEGSGREIISTLNAALTNPNHHFSLILAGYEEAMQSVFDLDPGFRSRFGDNVVIIQDYKPELLRNIMLDHIKYCGYSVALDLLRPVNDIQENVFPANALDCFVKRIYDERDREKFGNARSIIAIADSAIKKCKTKCLAQEDFYNENVNKNWFSTEDVAVSLDWILGEIDKSLCGMDKIKDRFVDLAYEIQECIDNGGDVASLPIRGMILVGNPGTGKTTVSNLLGKLYHHFGILGTASVIRVSASKFASHLQGGSQEIAAKYIKKAQNRKAMLFVDEAHQLTNPSFDGVGVLQSFMEPTTDTEHPFMAVFAVYPDKLEAFKALDPGLISRMRIIRLEDYTANQLFDIWMLMAQKAGYIAREDTQEKLKEYCRHIYETRNSYTGNARRMQRLLEDMNDRRRRRCYTKHIDIFTPEGKTFIPGDIPNLNGEDEKAGKLR